MKSQVWVLRRSDGAIVGASADMATRIGRRGTIQCVANASALENISHGVWIDLSSVVGSHPNQVPSLPHGYTLALESLVPDIPTLRALAEDRARELEKEARSWHNDSISVLTPDAYRENSRIKARDYASQAALLRAELQALGVG